MEADDVQASHLPERGFQKNPNYQPENERRYHDEPASRDKVLGNAVRLDPAFLADSVDANHGAPVVDRQGNVLGGNGRAMSIRLAYENHPERAQNYRQAIREQAGRLGLDPAQVDGMRRPVLVRRMSRELDAGERQALVTAMNDSFTDSKEARAAGKTRGDRISRRTLEALAEGLKEADSLREFFDQEKSADVVDMLVRDGVIQKSERNALVGADGLLNPDGKKVVEQALRGRIARNYDTLASLPAAALGKIDAIIPHLLIAESVEGWGITRHMQDAIDLMAEYRNSGLKNTQTFLNELNILTGKTPKEVYSQKAQSLFLRLAGLSKKDFVSDFARYAAQAKLAAGGMGVGMTAREAGEKFLGFSRSELLARLPAEKRPQARRRTTPEIRKMAEEEARKGEPQAKGNGELPVVASVESGVIKKTSGITAIEAARQWVEKHLPASVKTSIGTIFISARSLKNSFHHSMYPSKLDAVQALDKVLLNGVHIDSRPDTAGKRLTNHFFAAKVRFIEKGKSEEKVVFVRARQAEGQDSRFYVHEVFTEEEIQKHGDHQAGTRDTDQVQFDGPHDFYKSLLADYLKVNAEQEETADALGVAGKDRPFQDAAASSQKMAAEENPVNAKRSELLARLPAEKRPQARRKTTPEIRKMAEEEARKTEPQAKGNGELPVVASVESGVIKKTDTMTAIQAAQKWIREHVEGPVKTVAGEVVVDAKGIEDSLYHRMYQDKLDAVQAIVPVLERGEYLGSRADKDGKPIENHYYAAKVKIGENEKIVFIRTRKAAGSPNRFYVHDIFTEEEIRKSQRDSAGLSDLARPFQKPTDFYKSLLADYLKVNEKSGETQEAGGKSDTEGMDRSAGGQGGEPAQAKPEALKEGVFTGLESLGWEKDGPGVRKNVGGGVAGGAMNPSGNRVVTLVYTDEKGEGALRAACGWDEILHAPLSERIRMLPDFRGEVTPENLAAFINGRIDRWAEKTAAQKQETPLASLKKDDRAADRTNSYGVPDERVTELGDSLSFAEMKKALEELAGQDLPNLIEGLTAQVNRNQREKMASEKAAAKSKENGFPYGKHGAAAAQIANIWKWAAQVARYSDRKDMGSGTFIRRFVSAVRIDGRDAFAWLTVKETPKGLRIYSIELTNEKKLWDYMGEMPKIATSTPAQSFKEIIDRLKAPVNESAPRASSSARPGEYLPPRGSKTTRLRREAARGVVDRLNRLAAKAASTRVVQHFAELPESLRKRYANQSQSVEGIYDPATDTVWFVADNLTDTGRVAEVWAHEQIVHHGLRGLFSRQQMRQVLNELFMSMGGYGNRLIRQIADAYGIDPRSSMQARLTVMEEVLAHLAESRKFGRLDGREAGLWRKVARAIARAWNRLVEAVSGRSARMDADRIDRVLAMLGRYVMDGTPARGLGGQGAEAMASVHGKQGATNSYGVPDERVTKIDREFTREEAREALQELSGRDLYNYIENITAQVNSQQREKLISGPAVGRSKGNNFSEGEHFSLAAQIANAWKWAVDTGVGGRKEEKDDPHVKIRRFVSLLSLNGRNLFAWLTIKETFGTKKQDGLRVYDMELINEKKLRHLMESQDSENPTDPARSFGEIIDRLKTPVNENAGGSEKPLASLNIRQILGMGAKDAAKVAEDPEIRAWFKDRDLSLFQMITRLPHWIAKEYKEFAAIYNRQLERLDEKTAALKESLKEVPGLFGENRLKGEDLKSLTRLLWEIEGSKLMNEKLKGVEKIVDVERLDNGRVKVGINPEFYDAYKEALDGMDATDAAKKAMLEIRKSLDNDFVQAHNRMAEMAEVDDDAITRFRESFGHVPNYFPHHRYGKYFIQARDAAGNVLYRRHFDAAGGSRRAAEKGKELIRELRKAHPDEAWAAKDVVWNMGENQKLPDEVLGAPLDASAMEQIIMAATSHIDDREQAGKIREILNGTVADILKARGWGSHGIERQNIPGFETDDIAKVLYDYKAGLYGWLTKMDAARDFGRMLSKIDARKTPNLWKYASQYVKDMLRNYDGIDRMTGNIKSVAFAWYLGANIKTAAVNMTQNLITGVPRLGMEVEGSGLLWLKSASDAIKNDVTGEKGNARLTEDERRLLRELYGEDVITSAFMDEVRGQLKGVSGARAWNRFTQILGKPMAVVETFNRSSLALAAYRAARDGKLKANARKRLGLADGQALTYEQAKAFATDIVRDAHFQYGKSNMPEFLRSGTAGRALSSMYTFRTFTHNMVEMWLWALRTQGREGAIFTAKSIGATMALGGVTALPFYATLMALFQLVTGDDDDWTEEIREALPQSDMLRDIVCYGAPALAGVNLGGSLKMETPLTRSLSKGVVAPDEALKNSIGDIIGIPYDLVSRFGKVGGAIGNGSYWRAIEEAVPTFVKNGMQAWRFFDEGQTTMTGRPINSPGRKGARKYTASEAVAKALGFQPVSATKSWDAYAAEERRKAVRGDKLNELAVLALKTFDSGSPDGRRKALRELADWNERMRKEGKPHMLISWPEVMRRVHARRKENSASPKQLEKGARQRAVWGV